MRRNRVMAFCLILCLLLVFNMSFAYGSSSVDRYTAKTYNHNEKYDDRVIVSGLDVSIYQKNIDWVKAKKDGIDYAIIRVGGRGYGTAGNMYADENFEKNIQGAKAAGLMVGVYFFSQAVNELEAVAEAEYALELIGSHDLDLPVFMDYEFSGGNAGRLTKANLSKVKATGIARKFCETIEKHSSFRAGIYANLNFLNKTIDGMSLGKEYPIWVAQYYNTCNYDHDYVWWQYTSDGTVFGIDARNDCNYWYLDINPVATSEYSLANCTGTIVGQSTFVYNDGQSFTPNVSVSAGWTTLVEGVDYKVRYVNNTKAGTGYAVVLGMGMYKDYLLIPFTINPNTSTSSLSVGKLGSASYTGKAVNPSSITITESSGRKLVEGLDYSYTVSDNVNAGSAKVKFSFEGNYAGTKTANFTIEKGKQSISLTDARTEIPIEQEPYNLGVKLKFTDGSVNYSSSNKEVAKVSSAGKVTVVSQGKTTITIKALGTDNYEGETKTLELTVTKPSQKITTEQSSYAKVITDEPFTLKDVKTNGDGKLSYKSSDEAVAKVSSKGKVTIVGTGSCVITVTAKETEKFNKGTLDIPIEVSKAEQSVTTSYTRYRREELDNSFKLNGKSNGDGKLSYTSLDESVVKVDEKGRVIIVGAGEAEILVSAAETDSYLEGSKLVTVSVAALEDEEKAAKLDKLTVGVEKTKVINVKAEPSQKKIKLSWKKSGSGFAVDYYEIQRSVKKSSGFKKIFTTSDAKLNYYINSKGLEPNTKYWYKIRGVRHIGEECVYTPYTKIETRTKK